MGHSQFGRKISLLDPVRKNPDFLIWLGLIIRVEVQAEIVLATHITVHQISKRDRSAFAGLEDHRTDGRCGGSAPLFNFKIRCFGEEERLIAHVGDENNIRNLVPQRDFAVVDGIFLNFKPG